MVEQADRSVPPGAFGSADTHQPVQVRLAERRMGAECHHEIHLAGIAQDFDEGAKKEWEWQ